MLGEMSKFSTDSRRNWKLSVALSEIISELYFHAHYPKAEELVIVGNSYILKSPLN